MSKHDTIHGAWEFLNGSSTIIGLPEPYTLDPSSFTGGSYPAAAIMPVFNVTGYGAVGNGIADDTDGIQAAFDEATLAGGGIVYFPSGTFLVSSQINIYSPNVIMRGAGPSTIIQAKDNANVNVMFWIQSSASNFTAEQFVLDGNRDNLGTSGAYVACLGFMCFESDGLLFRDVEVRYVNSIGIGVESASPFRDVRMVMERCYIHHNGMLTAKEGNDVFLYNVKNCTFTDCQFEHGYGTGGGGLYAGGGVVGSATKLRFVGCIFRDNFNGGGQTGWHGDRDIDERWEYLGCTFELTEADPHATAGIEMACRNLVVDGCEFYNHNSATGTGIAIHGDFSTGDDTGRVVITNNVFVNNFSAIEHADTGDLGVVIIANNRFQDGTRGVTLGQTVGSPATNVIITGNDFTDNITTPITADHVTNLVAFGNLPARTANPGDLSLGVNPASTDTFGALGLPNDLAGALMWRNAANGGDIIGAHMAGNDRLYLMNAHNMSATDLQVAGALAVTGDVAIGTNPAGTGTFGAIGLPNDLAGAIMWRNALNSGDIIGVQMGGNNRLYLMNAHNFGASDAQVSGTLSVTGNTIGLQTAKTPASAGAAGTQGDFCWDATYFYICVATNTWHRVAHATW